MSEPTLGATLGATLGHEESIALDESVISTLLDRLDVAARTQTSLLVTLDAVMATLTRAAASPSDQAIYERARCILREHGIGGDIEVHRRACEQWEAREEARKAGGM